MSVTDTNSMGAKAERVWDSYFGHGMDRAIDAFGLEVAKASYGKENSRYGWFVEHIRPKSMGGSDEIENLRPLSYRSDRIRANW